MAGTGGGQAGAVLPLKGSLSPEEMEEAGRPWSGDGPLNTMPRVTSEAPAIPSLNCHLSTVWSQRGSLKEELSTFDWLVPMPGKDLLTGLIEVGKPTLSGEVRVSWDGPWSE